MNTQNKINYIQPFNSFIPKAGLANQTIAPLYDTVSSQEAKKIAQDNAKSFLHVTKAEIDFEHTVPYNNPKVYIKAQENLQNFINNQVFVKSDKPVYLIYKIEAMHHTQLGLVAVCDTDAITNNYIKHHELTRESKETDRAKNITAVGGSISSVMFTHKSDQNITDTLIDLSDRQPDIIAKDEFKIIHSIYIVNNKSDIELITNNYNNLSNLYIADGHHRTQAANRVAKELADNSSASKFLVTIFPEEQLNILGYHRVVKDLNGYTADEFLPIIFKYFDIEPNEHAVLPHRQHEFGMFLNKRWYKLKLKPEIIENNNSENNIESNLDCNILNNLILEPILGITDIRTDSRIDFIGGSKPYREIEDFVNHHEGGVGFTLAPTSIQDLFDISDNNLLMPPKSTWFYPKLCDGLFFYMFD